MSIVYQNPEILPASSVDCFPVGNAKLPCFSVSSQQEADEYNADRNNLGRDDFLRHGEVGTDGWVELVVPGTVKLDADDVRGAIAAHFGVPVEDVALQCFCQEMSDIEADGCVERAFELCQGLLAGLTASGQPRCSGKN